MDTPFFDVLGVPAHADARAVRRAYAALLKRIDAAADPSGFARLREAYDAAMAYCAVHEPADSTTIVAPESAPGPSPDMPARAASEVSPEDDLAHTLRLAEGFAVAAQHVPPDKVRTLLVATIGDLRLGYIDAPGRFEERVIDLLMTGAVGRRDVLFAALAEELHWNEIGRLAPLGSRGRWVEAVLVQEVAWRQVMLKKRAPILELLREADSAMSDDLVPLWPRVRAPLQEFPEYLGLFLRDARAAEWRARYNARIASTDTRTARSPRPKPPRESRRYRTLALVLLLIYPTWRAVTDVHTTLQAWLSPAPSYAAPATQSYAPSRLADSTALPAQGAECKWLMGRFGRYSVGAQAGPPAGSEQERALKACRQRITQTR